MNAFHTTSQDVVLEVAINAAAGDRDLGLRLQGKAVGCTGDATGDAHVRSIDSCVGAGYDAGDSVAADSTGHTMHDAADDDRFGNARHLLVGVTVTDLSEPGHHTVLFGRDMVCDVGIHVNHDHAHGVTAETIVGTGTTGGERRRQQGRDGQCMDSHNSLQKSAPSSPEGNRRVRVGAPSE